LELRPTLSTRLARNPIRFRKRTPALHQQPEHIIVGISNRSGTHSSLSSL
jgi:hypothetical protein